eukprot:5168993-Karenia_brevis.AAC.1
MDCIARSGKMYGGQIIFDGMGDQISVKICLKYLGAHLAADGRLEGEIAQKIGFAEQEFKTLAKIWNH